MTNPRQDDYGTADSKDVSLVPDSLIAYRHFAVLDSELWPMNGMLNPQTNPYRLETRNAPRYDWGPSVDWTLTAGDGCNCPMCRPDPFEDPSRGTFPARRSDGSFQATCMRALYNFGNLSWTLAKKRGYHEATHEAPHKDCKCGFYAHYAPDEDFYSDGKWCYAPDNRYRDPLAFDMGREANRIILVRAVVELSGRIILGTKGVRAERMQVRALTPDWAKYQSPIERQRDLDYWAWYSDKPSLRYTFKPEGPSPETRQQVREELRRTAVYYNIAFYDQMHPNVMYNNYPQPDISHLLKGDE